jgi:hypothetical protein
MRHRFTFIVFLCLVAAMLGRKPTSVTSASPATDSDLLSADDPPRPAAFFFELQPADGGVRHLVLRDDADLVLPLGDVQPFWACDTDINYDRMGRYGMRVECGGDKFGATAYYSGYLGPERAVAPKWEVEVRSHGERPVEHTVSLMPQTQVTFVPDLPDPQKDCDPSGPTDVDVSHKPGEIFYDTPGNARTEQLIVRVKAYSIETMVGAARGQDCHLDGKIGEPYVRLRCFCPQDLSDRTIEVIGRDGALVWRDESAPTCAGRPRIHGGWRLGCGAKVHWWWEMIPKMLEAKDDATLAIARNL